MNDVQVLRVELGLIIAVGGWFGLDGAWILTLLLIIFHEFVD